MRTILLYSGWQTANIGDIGHTTGTVRYLTQHIPDARLTVCVCRSNPAILAMLQRRFPTAEFFGSSFDSQGRATTPELQAAFEKCEMFIQNSGMIYNRFWHASPRIVDLCAQHGKALCIYGQSFDGFPEETEAEWAERLANVDLIYTREADSLAYLRRIGARPGVLEFGPDGCFGSDVRDEARATAYLRESGLQDGEFLVVILRSNTPKMDGESDVLNPKTPSPEETAQDEHWSAQLRDVITQWVERTGHKVLLAPEVDKEITPAKANIRDKLSARIRAQVVHRAHFWNVDEATSVYARARAMVAMEPHSCILALANGTPAIHFYTRKHGIKAAMFRDIGLPEWLMDIDELPAQACTDALLQIEADTGRARAKVERAMNFVHARSAEMMNDLRRILEGRGAGG